MSAERRLGEYLRDMPKAAGELARGPAVRGTTQVPRTIHGVSNQAPPKVTVPSKPAYVPLYEKQAKERQRAAAGDRTTTAGKSRGALSANVHEASLSTIGESIAAKASEEAAKERQRESPGRPAKGSANMRDLSAPMYEDAAKERHAANGGDKKAATANLRSPIGDRVAHSAASDAARAVNVSPRSIEHALRTSGGDRKSVSANLRSPIGESMGGAL